MNTPASQDTDSGKAGTPGEVVTPGEPVQHTDTADGQSVGHRAEPEHSEGSSGNEPPAPADGSPPRAEDNPPPVPPPKVSRDDIYAKAKTGRAAELEGDLADMTEADRLHVQRMEAEAGGETLDPFAQGEEPPAAPPEGQQTPTQPQAAPNQPPAQGQQPPETGQQGIDTAAETTTITVYGMQEDVPTAEIEAAGGISAYQKARAADVRLERLSNYENSLRNWEQQLSERSQQAQPAPGAQDSGSPAPEPSPTDVPGSTVDVGELAGELTDAIYSGDREEAAAKLKDAFAQVSADAVRAAQAVVPAHAQPSTDDLEAQRAEKAARDEANAVFSREFRDLNTSVLKQAALNMVQEVARDPVMIGRPLAEITREACGRVREDVYGTREAPPGYEPLPTDPAAPGTPLHNAPPPPPQADLAGRHQLKRRTVVSPLTEATGRTPPPDTGEAAFPSNSEFVTNLRKGRGQPA